MEITARELLTRAQKDIRTLFAFVGSGANPIALGRASDTLDYLDKFLAAHNPGDTVAVELKSDDARTLAKFIDSAPLAYENLSMDDTWERIDAALVDALLAYDGPDGEDDRVFADASGKPHYEP